MKRKKIISLLLVVILCLNVTIFAVATEQTFSVEQVAVELLNDALKQPNYFDIPDLDGKTIYLCNAINPYTLEGDDLQLCNDIEYYLVKTDDEYIACITLCYKEGELVSACLNIGVAETVNVYCDVNEAIQLVVQEGVLFVKTENNLAEEVIDTQGARTVAVVSHIIDDMEGTLEIPTVKAQLVGITTNPVIARSSKILSVPYVSQENKPICWAAAAAAFGRYYTGETYAHYSASDLAEFAEESGCGADFATTRRILREYFGIETTFYDYGLPNSTAINLFQQTKPILAGFYGMNYNTEPDSEVGHMVVLCGYDDHNTGVDITYYVRDSNTESLMTVISYTDGVLYMDYYQGILMQWVESAHYAYIP